MISQVLNADYLLSAAGVARTDIKNVADDKDRRAGGDHGDLAPFTQEQLREVSDELMTALRSVGAYSSDPLNTEMWMPRQPILAILQTELTKAFNKEPGLLVDETAGVASRRLATDPGTPDTDGRRAFGPFEVTRPKILSDPRWVWAGVIIAWQHFKEKVAFGGLPEESVAIAEDARIIMVGDWGSGLPRAQAVAGCIRDELDRGIADGREQHVVHMGDVYYTGAKEEYTDNFLAYWPVRDGEDIGSYTLCGNHDMYRGGHEYYRTALADSRFGRQAAKSVFGLRNANWQFLGLDTAYEDERLSNGQVEWVARQIDSAPQIRTTLLSHHQLWSAYEDVGAQLRSQLADILAKDRIDAWFWGHEHRCLTYDPKYGVGFASCVGHGGVPEYLRAREGSPYPPGLRYDFRLKHGTGIEPWNTFGFAVVDLQGREMAIRYVDESGREQHREVVSP